MLVVFVLLGSACVGPSRTDADYVEKAANTAEAARSAVVTTLLVVDASSEGKAPARYVSLTISEAEEDVSSIASSFQIVQPPSQKAAVLRDEVTSALGDATTALANLRIAARAGRLTDLPRLAEPLAEVSAVLEEMSRRTTT